MMQQWADYLDRLKAGADVILLPNVLIVFFMDVPCTSCPLPRAKSFDPTRSPA